MPTGASLALWALTGEIRMTGITGLTGQASRQDDPL
jgi:hypothetical protein